MTERLLQVLSEIEAERRRQVLDDGWTPEHDDRHIQGALARAAASDGFKGRRRALVKAAALIVAEIERLDRATKTEN